MTRGRLLFGEGCGKAVSGSGAKAPHRAQAALEPVRSSSRPKPAYTEPTLGRPGWPSAYVEQESKLFSEEQAGMRLYEV